MAQPEPSSHAGKKLPHILLVEDNIIALRIAETLIKQAGCSVTTVSDGEIAKGIVKSADFDLIITDLSLPGLSGMELTQFIREWELSSHKKPVPIVGLTAQPLAEVENDCLQIGMNKVFIKPIYLHTVQKLIEEFVLQDGV